MVIKLGHADRHHHHQILIQNLIVILGMKIRYVTKIVS